MPIHIKGSGGVQETPVISVSTSGLITAKAGEKSSTYQLPTQDSKTITPSSFGQTAVEKGKFTTGAVTVKNLKFGRDVAKYEHSNIISFQASNISTIHMVSLYTQNRVNISSIDVIIYAVFSAEGGSGPKYTIATEQGSITTRQIGASMTCSDGSVTIEIPDDIGSQYRFNTGFTYIAQYIGS